MIILPNTRRRAGPHSPSADPCRELWNRNDRLDPEPNNRGQASEYISEPLLHRRGEMQSIVNLPSCPLERLGTRPHAAAAAVLQQFNRLQLGGGSGTSTPTLHRHSQVWMEDGTEPPRETGRKSLWTREGSGRFHARAGLRVFFYQLPLSRARPLVLVCPSPLHAPSPPAAVHFPMRRYGAPITAVARETGGTGFSHAVRWLCSVTQATAMVLPL